ncbi:lipocalin family protein [Streptomyces sp. NPDC057217]|uniref:lipocalin family protein n=1 Tax=Streptomyces sp. NPDC057217 TaxID=3346054 RepID=UPI0036372337
MLSPLRVIARNGVAVLGASALIAVVPCATTASAVSGRSGASVGNVDLKRYAGTWYQVAAVPQLFEIQCAGNTKAVYRATGRGTVSVVNSCTTWLGTVSSIRGEAKPLDASGTRLNVSFLPRLTGKEGYLHDSTANYVVAGLGTEYDWAVVTNESRDAGFILSRTPRLDGTQSAAVLAAVSDAGLDIHDFRATRQDDRNGS